MIALRRRVWSCCRWDHQDTALEWSPVVGCGTITSGGKHEWSLAQLCCLKVKSHSAFPGEAGHPLNQRFSRNVFVRKS